MSRGSQLGQPAGVELLVPEHRKQLQLLESLCLWRCCEDEEGLTLVLGEQCLAV